jgi:hypothetical protein
MSRRHHAIAVAVTVGIACGSSPAHAWEPIDASRPVWRGAVPYALQSAGSADLGGFGPTEAEVRRGMDDWTRVACTSLTTRYDGSVSSLPRNGDGVSSIGWLESGWPYDSNAIGVTTPQFFRSIGEADMQMNGVNFTWTTESGRGSRVNAYSIVAHEGGHYYGLGHSSDGSAIMYFAYGGGIGTIGTDDQNGICALYPGSSSDCTTTGCPSGYECTGGMCTRVMGDGDTCSPCDSSSACSMGICLGYPDGNGYCGRTCASDADCGGDRCVRIDGAANQCIRVRGASPSCASGPAGCATDSDCSPTQRCNPATGACIDRGGGGDLGAACGGAADCSSGVCFSGTCSQSCNWLDPASCPSGYYCNGQATGTCNAGLCLPGAPGGGALGDPCGSATECSTLFCAEGTCSTPCIPGGASGCPDGTTCQMGVSADCGSCQRAAGLGDACLTNEECASRMCAAAGGMSFCTSFCDASRPCPSGFSCLPVDATTSVCAPDRGGLGAPCTSNEACASGICATFGSGPACTRTCDATNACPRDYECALTGDGVTSVCQRSIPTRSNLSGGCGRCAASATGARPLGWASLSLLGLLLAGRTSRRKRGAGARSER